MRLGLLSFWHVHAADYAREAIAHPDIELACIWDEDSARGAAEAAARAVPFVPDLDQVLADPAIDGVIVTSATTAHAELLPRAARTGKHIFVEKVLAPTLSGALDLADEATEAGVVLGVALSRAEHPAVTRMRALIDEGAIGLPAAVRVRLAHDGVVPADGAPRGWLPEQFLDPHESGGGAMIDLGAHPLYLTRLLLGMPATVSATFGRVTGAAADDNSAALFGYDDGVIGIAETSFVSGGAGLTIEVHGRSGGLTYSGDDDRLLLLRRRSGSEQIAVNGVWSTPFERWVEAAVSGGNADANLLLALELSALAEAAARSASQARTVALAELDGWDRLQRWPNEAAEVEKR
jgi:predicted dehydrogenase